jgi:hypothetical protein
MPMFITRSRLHVDVGLGLVVYAEALFLGRVN